MIDLLANLGRDSNGDLESWKRVMQAWRALLRRLRDTEQDHSTSQLRAVRSDEDGDERKEQGRQDCDSDTIYLCPAVR